MEKSKEAVNTEPYVAEDKDVGVKDIEKVPFKLHQVKPVMPNDHEYKVNRYAKIIERTSDGFKQLVKGGTIFRKFPKVGRNKPCSCNSGVKYKFCCGG